MRWSIEREKCDNPLLLVVAMNIKENKNSTTRPRTTDQNMGKPEGEETGMNGGRPPAAEKEFAYELGKLALGLISLGPSKR